MKRTTFDIDHKAFMNTRYAHIPAGVSEKRIAQLTARVIRSYGLRGEK